MLKKLLRNYLPTSWLYFLKKKYARIQLKKWEMNGFPVPPPHIVKQMAIAHYQQLYGCETFVETGTYMGDMVEAQRKRFEKVFSIELSTDLYQKAVRKFRRYKHISILQGDSGKVMPGLMNHLKGTAVFWLDGHYSAGVTAKGDKECPIYEELESILKKGPDKHVLLIDDARCFTGENDYPTIAELIAFVKGKDSRYQVEIKHDIIRFFI